MSSNIEAFRVRGIAGVDNTVRARVKDADKTLITQASLTNAYLQIFDEDGTAVENSELTISSVIFDTLQTGAEWTADDVGYNMEVVLPADALTDATQKYSAIVWCVPVGSGISDFPIRFEVDLTPVQKASYPA